MAMPMTETVMNGKPNGHLVDLLKDIDRDFINKKCHSLSSLVNWGHSGEAPIHRWYKYREGFSPELISALGLGNRILDPFCGGGSIMIGAAQQNRSSVGIDVNPLAVFTARVKITPLATKHVKAAEQFRDQFMSKIDRIAPHPVPDLRIADKVFEPEILDALLRLHSLIDLQMIKPLHDFLLLAWLSILQDVGSYYNEGNGIKYRNKKRLKTGYVTRIDGEWQRKRFGADQRRFVYNVFHSKLDEMLSDIDTWSTGRWGDQRVFEGNSLRDIAALEAGSFDSVVFSPPYANRFDYFESMKVELWFGGFVSSYEDMMVLRKRSLRSHLGAALESRTRSLPEVQELIDMFNPDSYAVRTRIPDLLHGYFEDMYAILQLALLALKPGGNCNIIVGNSAYGGVIIPTDALIARLGIDAGFEKATVVPVRHLTVAPQQRKELCGYEEYMRESIVMLS